MTPGRCTSGGPHPRLVPTPQGRKAHPTQPPRLESQEVTNPPGLGTKPTRGSPGAGQRVQLTFGPVPLVAVAGLELPNDLVPLAGGLVQVVVGQVAPLLLDLA